MTPFMNWSIPSDRLIGPRSRGGQNAKAGFDFQDAYASLQICRLLDEDTDIIAVRSEGAQDVDLLYKDGREEYIQIKNSPNERYTLDVLAPILQGFALNLLKASRSSTIIFTLLARSNNIDTVVTKLENKSYVDQDLKKISDLLIKSTQNYRAPECLMELSDSERYNLAAQLLDQTKFQFGIGDMFEGRFSFESHACSKMAKHGVGSADLHDAFNVIKGALNIKREFFRTDVEELLKQFIGRAAIEIFEGSAEAVSDELFSHPASPERIQLYYAGAPLGWDIIAAHGDIERDQHENLFERLRQPSETLKMVCIVAEPGAGKSTLARRLAADLYQERNAFLIRIKNKEDAQVWYNMPKFYQKIKRPFYVLMDDVFRDQDVLNALCELDQSLPITILATSRSNEYRTIRFGGESDRLTLKKPSPEEKDRLIARLGKNRNDLTSGQRQRLDDANQFLVLMIELTDPKGRRLEEIVEDTVEWLKIKDESTHRAYEYLCFAYQFGISIPVSLLERLDPNERFYNLPNRPTAQGLIFYDEDRARTIRVGHPIIADIAYSIYKEFKSPTSVLSDIIDAIDKRDNLEIRFAGHLLRALAQAKSPFIMTAFPEIDAFIVSCKQYATVHDLCIWRAFYLDIDNKDRAEDCVDTALERVPLGPIDCQMLLFFYRERGREKDAVPVLAKWIYENPDYSLAPYIGLIERYGTNEEIKRVLQETSDWLLNHANDTAVRMPYLGLVERNGTNEEIKRVLQETSDWLSNHPDEKEVFIAFIPTLIRLGRLDEALEVASEAISNHQDNQNLIETYLRLIRESADEQTVRILWNRLIARNPKDPKHLIEFAAWLRDHDKFEESESLYKELIKIPKEKTTKKLMEKTHYGYGRLLMEYKRYLEAAEQFRQTLGLHMGHQMAHSWLATALRNLGNLAKEEGNKQEADRFFAEAVREFRQAIYWAGVQKQPQAVFYTNLGWLYINWEKYSDAVESFSSAAKESPEFFVNYWGLGKAQMALGQFQKAENALRKASEKAPEDLNPPASEEIPELLRQCENELNKSGNNDKLV